MATTRIEEWYRQDDSGLWLTLYFTVRDDFVMVNEQSWTKGELVTTQSESEPGYLRVPVSLIRAYLRKNGYTSQNPQTSG